MIWISFAKKTSTTIVEKISGRHHATMSICCWNFTVYTLYTRMTRYIHTFSAYLIQNRLTFFSVVLRTLMAFSQVHQREKKELSNYNFFFCFSLAPKPNQFSICICIWISIVKFNPKIQQNGDSFFSLLFVLLFFFRYKKVYNVDAIISKIKKQKRVCMCVRESKKETKTNEKNSSFISVIHFMTMF